MYSKLQLAYKYLQYLLRASNGKGHGIHSPFVFDFVVHVLNDKRTYYCYQPIEALRRELRRSSEVVTVEDFGAGSRVSPQRQRSVGAIAASALKPKKFGQLLFRMVNYYGPASIIELGSSLGITTSYLASARCNARVITMEGAPAIAAKAQQHFARLALGNVELVCGNFDDTLPLVLHETASVDFAFVDGNHRKVPTLSYFQQLLQKASESSVFIFDDIHWSKEMEEAWHEIQAHDAVTLTIDLFFIGIVFFRKENKVKQHFVIRY